MQPSRDVTSETAQLGFVEATQQKDTKGLHGRVIHERDLPSVRPKRAWGKPVEHNGFEDHKNTTEHNQSKMVSYCTITAK